MVVYGEYLFIENFIIGFIILKLTGKICGCNPRMFTYIIGSAACGIYSFTVFLNMGSAAELVARTSFAAVLSGIVFGFRRALKCTVVFYIISFAMGGISLAMIYLSDWRGFAGNGYLYISEITYSEVAKGVLAGASMVAVFTTLMKNGRKKEILNRKLIIRIGEKENILKGYVDTGNHLRDEVTGAPVFIISKEAADKIMFDTSSDEKLKRYCAVPFKAAGTKCGIMDGFRADMLTVITEGETSCYASEPIRYSPAIFGIYDGSFKARDGISGFDVLLNREVIEGGFV